MNDRSADQPSAADVELERMIREATEEHTLKHNKATAAKLRTLINQRSPEMVERMERERGLR